MSVDRSEQEKSSGAATDAFGNPVPDPTKNVLDLVEAGNRRQDDLREAHARTLEAESRHLREIMDIRERFYKELRHAETARIDAIRSVDISAATRQLEVASQQAAALAASLVATEQASRTALDLALGPMREDIRTLLGAQASYQGGKEQSTDTRLNIGALVGVAGFVMGIVLAVASFALR